MPVSAFTKYNIFAEDLSKKIHDLRAAGDTLKVLLSNTAPVVATHVVRADTTELSTANGYTSGGVDTQNDLSRTGGTVSITGVDVTITAAGGSIGPFRYVILYNDTPTSPADPLIGFWDYGAALTLADGDSLVLDIGTSMFTVV